MGGVVRRQDPATAWQAPARPSPSTATASSGRRPPDATPPASSAGTGARAAPPCCARSPGAASSLSSQPRYAAWVITRDATGSQVWVYDFDRGRAYPVATTGTAARRAPSSSPAACTGRTTAAASGRCTGGRFARDAPDASDALARACRAPRVDSPRALLRARHPGGTMSVIKAEHLTKRFGKKVLAVDDVSFAIEAGTITGVLGPNGAGKTTTLRMILDLVRPTAGSVTILGSRYRGAARARRQGRRAPRRLRLPPRPLRPQRAARDRHRRRHPRRARRRDPRAGRARGRGEAGGQGLLHRHEAAPGAGRGAARRPRGAHPRRAGQRPRPGGDALAAHVPAQARGRGPHRRSSPATCSPRSSRRWTTS